MAPVLKPSTSTYTFSTTFLTKNIRRRGVGRREEKKREGGKKRKRKKKGKRKRKERNWK
tara:strand:- start:30 stop:206 length:177 start_codon:yes stop_codon:yes gene_type:complete